ncbi:hypothetical protein CICLE_v10030342mg, partial [Citrus x clementina]
SRPKLEKRGNSGCWVQVYSKGDVYKDRYQKGKYSGSDVYAGEWSNGQSHGCGVHTCEDGSQYVGEFKWGVKHGLGHCHFRNGDTYAREYFADKMHGFSVYCFANGHWYGGVWHEGIRQGLAMYTFKNGKTNLGKMELLTFQARRIRLILYHLLQFTTPKYSMQCMYLNLFNQKQMHHSNSKDSIPLAIV